MPLFTSSSESRKRRNSQLLNLALFAGTFVPLVGLTAIAWLVVPHAPMPVAVPKPASDDYYLAMDGPIALDHRVLFHGQYDTAKHLKAADVLLLGNSRLMFGFPQDPFKKAFERFNMSYYMLGFGHAECDLFPMDLIRKFDLHPKMVIINADHFFTGTRNPFSEKIIRESKFEARKQIFEGEATHFVRNRLHRILPHWMYRVEQRWEMIVYRSRKDGTWLGPDFVPWAFPVPARPGVHAPKMQPYQLDVATKFKEELEQRGARVVLTFFPSEYGTREHAEHFARHLDVPLVSPRLNGLETFDLSHLNHKSATRFTTAFVADLERTLNPLSPTAPEFAARPPAEADAAPDLDALPRMQPGLDNSASLHAHVRKPGVRTSGTAPRMLGN